MGGPSSTRKGTLMITRQYVESVALYLAGKGVIFLGVALALSAAGIGLSHFGYFGVVYGQFHDDSVWYGMIAQTGYMPQDTPFFPLYPLLIGGLSRVFNIPIVTAGTILSNFFWIMDIGLLMALYRRVLGSKLGKWAGALWVFYPMAFFLPSMYTESLFVFGMAGALLMIESRHYVLAGIFAAVATLTRNTGVLLLIPFGWALIQDIRGRWDAKWPLGSIENNNPDAGYTIKNKRIRKLRDIIPWRGVLGALFIPASVSIYFVYLWARFGSPLTWDGMQRLWGREPMNPLMTLYKGFQDIPYLWSHTAAYGHIYYTLQYGALIIALASLPIVWKHLPRAWFFLMLAQIIIPLCDPGTGVQTITGTARHIQDYFFSFDRFTITFIPLFAALAIRAHQLKASWGLILAALGSGLAACSGAITLHVFLG